MLTIPTLQAAVALIVHLPAGCTVSSESQPGLTVGRLVLSQKKVEEIFRRKVTKFSQLGTTGKNNVFAGAKCKKATEITRVVRLEGAGTTAQLKKWLKLVNGKAEAVVNGKTWLESGEEPPANTEWPEETTKLIRGKGNSGVVAEVEKTAGSIGYVDLTNARKGPKLVPPEGGEGKEEFWAELENKETTDIEGITYKLYADPATNGDVAEKANSNCGETDYVSIDPETGKAAAGKFPPPSTEGAWNLVSAEAKQKNYSLCGFTYGNYLGRRGVSGGRTGDCRIDVRGGDGPSAGYAQPIEVERDRVVKAFATDRAAQSPKDMVGIVVGAFDVGWLAVASKGDRAGPGPRAEARARLLEVGVRGEPELVGVLGGSQHEVAHELDRGRHGRRVVGAEDAVGEPAQCLILHVVWPHRVLDPET